MKKEGVGCTASIKLITKRVKTDVKETQKGHTN